MPTLRLVMRKAAQILRLHFGHGQSVRAVARSTGVARSTVNDTIRRARRVGLSWPLPTEVDQDGLEQLLYPTPVAIRERPSPDFKHIHRELRRKGVTLELLWLEYKAAHPAGAYSYSRFCELVRAWRGKLEVSMRQNHVAGEKLFVDFAGMTMPITDPGTGEISKAEIFVAALGASDLIYAEATPGQDSRSWLSAHVHGFEYFGGVAALTVPDNLKSGVIRPSRYEPDIQAAYEELADHYGTAVIPARVRRPQDKAKVEQAVLMVERWVLAPLRNHTFFSIADLNAAIRDKLIELNDRLLTELKISRRALFEQTDKPALMPLPPTRYEYAQWRRDVLVGVDYHVTADEHHYSVPYKLTRERVDVRMTLGTVEIFRKGRRIASHVRSTQRAGQTTDTDHMPDSHRRYAEWSPQRVVACAEEIGGHTAMLVDEILQAKPHPEQGFRSCLGIVRLATKYGAERLEAACRRARYIDARTFRSVESILKHSLDNQPLPTTVATDALGDHDNLRGPRYYH